MWEHHPSHFWLVLASAVISAALAFSTSGVPLRRADARLFLVSLAFFAAAGFLALHALATPGVLLDGPNQGFVIATPVGLLVASVFAAASALPLGPERARAVIRHATLLRGVLIAAMAAWAAVSLGSVPPLDDPTPAERASGVLLVLAVLAVPLYAAAGWHVLMLAAFGAIAWSARREEPEERFSDLYLDDTAAGKREISVLFADLSGFTSFSEGRDPREVSEMLNAYFEVAIPPIVREYGGQIDRLVGDA